MAILESAAVWITERAADATSISFEEQTLLWQGLTDFPKEQAFAARLFGRVSGLVNIAEKARSIEGTASITDLCGGSMVLTGPWDDPDEGMRAFDLLRLHRDHGLPIEIESDPHEARRRFDRFRPGSIERDLLLRVKTAFDPEHIMRRGHWLTDEGAQ